MGNSKYSPVVFKGQNAAMINGGGLEFKDGTLFQTGDGTPEGASVAPIGSSYQDITNGVSYTKSTGTGNTGWVQDASTEDIPNAVEDPFVPTLAQTIFALSSTPSGDAAFALYLNGQLRLRDTDYTQVGTVLTWLDPAGLTLEITDELIARYNDTAGGGGSFDITTLSKVNLHSVDFDGINDSLSVPATADLQFERTDAFSFSFWLRPQTAAQQTIYSAEITSGTFRGVAIRLIGQKVRFIITNTTVTNQLSIEMTGSYAFSQWQHFVVTYDGSSTAAGVTIYRDDASQGLTTNTDNLSATIVYTGSIRLGARTDGGLPYQNNINDLAIFDAELDATDVSEIFAQRNFTDLSTLTKASNLIHHWRMGDGATGSIIPDEIGSSDATILGSPGPIVSEAP